MRLENSCIIKWYWVIDEKSRVYVMSVIGSHPQGIMLVLKSRAVAYRFREGMAEKTIEEGCLCPLPPFTKPWFSLQHCMNKTHRDMLVTPELSLGPEAQRFKVILDYPARLNPAWAIQQPLSQSKAGPMTFCWKRRCRKASQDWELNQTWPHM